MNCQAVSKKAKLFGLKKRFAELWGLLQNAEKRINKRDGRIFFGGGVLWRTDSRN